MQTSVATILTSRTGKIMLSFDLSFDIFMESFLVIKSSYLLLCIWVQNITIKYVMNREKFSMQLLY